MALDIQTIAMTSGYVPYERPPQNLTLWSAIPRGLQSFIVATEILDAKALNDDAILQLTATLPPNFGYVMQDLQVNLAQDRMFDWDNECNLNLQNFFRAPQVLSGALSINWRQDFFSVGQDESQRSLVLAQPWPSFPIIGVGATGAQVLVSMYNNNNAAALVGTVNAYLSLWVFDLEQIRKYPINSPVPTHAR